MGRFESPIQVVGLFLAASVVSIGVIFFLNAEAHSRLHHKTTPQSDQHISSQSPSAPYYSYLTQEEGHQNHRLLQKGEHQSILEEENKIIKRNNNNINKDNNGKSFSFTCLFLYLSFSFPFESTPPRYPFSEISFLWFWWC